MSGSRIREAGGRVAPPEKYLVGLGDDTIDDLGGRRNVMDEPDGLAGNDRRDVEIAGGLGVGVFGGDRFDILQQFEFAAAPAPRMIVDQAAPVERRRPDIVA